MLGYFFLIDDMTKKPARPWTVWTTQVIAGLFFALLAYAIFLAVKTLFRSQIPGLFPQRALGAGLAVALACGYLIVLIGLGMRSFAGRWLGVAGLLLPAGYGIFLLTIWIRIPRGLENAMLFYGSMAGLLFLIGSIPFFGFLAYRLARGVREKEFFSRPERAITAPPPPPVF
jgi:hypothetical protein